jgi:raffinose/stachyose/melibiose transport system substrate-binding protein
MKRAVTIVAVLLAVSGMAFARAASESTGGASTETITLSGYMQIDPANEQYSYWNPTLEAFAKAYPNIKVEFEYTTGEQFHDKFQTMAAANQIPDLFTCYAGERSSYLINRGAVKDLRPYLTDAFKADYSPAIWEPQGPNGEIYIIAPNMSVCAVFVANPKLLQSIGLPVAKTFDELVAQAPKIIEAGMVPMSFGNQEEWLGSSTLLSLMVERMAGKDWFDQAKTGAAKFTDKPFLDALNVIKTMVDNKIIQPGANQIDRMGSVNQFVTNKAPYILTVGWYVSNIKNAADPADYAQYQVLPFPAITGEVSPGSSVATTGEALAMNNSLTGAKADAAWKFLSFVYGPVGADLMYQVSPPVTYKLDLSKYNLSEPEKQNEALTTSSPMGYVFDAIMDGEGVNNILNPDIQALIMGDKTPQQVAQDYETWVAANDSHRK